MQSWEREAYIKQEAHEQGHSEGLDEGLTERLIDLIQRKLEKSLDVETIADHLETDTGTIDKIIRAIRSCPEGSDAKTVYLTMRKPAETAS